MNRRLILFVLLLNCGCHSASTSYPPYWWSPVDDTDAAPWEILPQAAGPGEVVLSKRNELGLLSNFAATPFVYDRIRYASLEGFWQMMKYPENPTDPRAVHLGLTWEHTRAEVSNMVSFEAKRAGDLASRNMRIMDIDWVTYNGRKMPYRSGGLRDHYRLIVDAMREKVKQNRNVRRVLMSTGNLKLLSDHRQKPDAPPAWRYHEILMMLRDELRGD